MLNIHGWSHWEIVNPRRVDVYIQTKFSLGFASPFFALGDKLEHLLMILLEEGVIPFGKFDLEAVAADRGDSETVWGLRGERRSKSDPS